MKKLIIAFPVFNEGPLIKEFVEALDRVVAALSGYSVELLIVNDGSTDNTLEEIRSASLKSIPSATVINLGRNTGHPYAIQCILDHTPGPATVILDADFQDNPDVIPQIVDAYEKTGVDIVRVARSDYSGGFFYPLLFNGFRWVYRWVTRERYAFGTFGLYSARAIQSLRMFSAEAHPYFPGLVTLAGMKTVVLSVPRSVRKQGQSKMGLRRLFRLAFDAIFSFSVFPIRLASFFGVLITGLGLAAIGVIVYIRLFTTLAIPGWSSILTGVTFFGGVQLLFLGILGEYVARIFEQVKNRPHYFVESSVVLTRSSHAASSS